MIFVVEDDRGWEKYYRRLLKNEEVEYFHDGIMAIQAIDEHTPTLIILDILLNGPTGFAVLNELQSYLQLAKVPVMVVSSVALDVEPLKKYGVVATFDKGDMLPQDLLACVKRYNHA